MKEILAVPLVSVLMGVFYRSTDTAALERSVDSILRQSLSNLELLVCDDGSCPQACHWLERMSKQDRRLRLIRCGGLYSLPEKLNVCIRHAQGEWLARMDDDDFSHPHRLEQQLEFLKAHSEIAFVGCNATLYRAGVQVGMRRLPERPQVQDFYFVQPFLHPALLFRRESIEAVGGYSEESSCRLCEDYDLLLRLYQAGYTGANLPEPLLDYTLPLTAKGNRLMRHRWNEAVTRYQRFRALRLLPEAFPWVLKPLVVGLLPEKALRRLKKMRENTNGCR